MQGIINLHFDDFTPEEYTPSKGAGSGRIDFIFKRDKIAFETKSMLRSGLTPAKLRAEIHDDIGTYQGHPDIKHGTLIVLVYDPNKDISSPRSFEKDFEQANHGDIKVKVIIVN